jgi:hypothetical protein
MVLRRVNLPNLSPRPASATFLRHELVRFWPRSARLGLALFVVVGLANKQIQEPFQQFCHWPAEQ